MARADILHLTFLGARQKVDGESQRKLPPNPQFATKAPQADCPAYHAALGPSGPRTAPQADRPAYHAALSPFGPRTALGPFGSDVSVHLCKKKNGRLNRAKNGIVDIKAG